MTAADSTSPGNTSSSGEDSDCHNDDTPPDGGAPAWLCVLGAWCASFVSYGWINSIGTWQEYYQNGPLKAYSPSQISWITSLQVFFISFLGPVIGQVYDRGGMRYLIRVGSFMHVFGLMMASLSTEYYQILLSQGVCSSIGVAMVFVCAFSTISDWFLKRRGLAFGVLATGSSLGGVIFPIMTSNLIKTVGYGWTMRIDAFLIMALLVVSNLTVRSRRAPRPVKLNRESLARPFTELTFNLLVLGLFLMPFGMYVPITYLPVAAQGEGYVSSAMAINLVAFYNAASLFGRLGSGWLSDRYGKYNIYIICGYLSGILVLALWIPARTEAAAIAFALLFGLASGAYISLMGALVPCISPMEEIGYRNGITFLSSAIGGLITSPIAGVILVTPARWTGLKLFAGAFLLAGTTGVVFARVSRTGLKLNAIF
ncbi:major facilitator superfamily transporter [Microdochium trichocladiopsis]|uniref:Major facilitator superfamily transporter n=1 Tax=Microdochium trichocladiopsis TaxID=1682393 RepID=A0A9P8XSL7_9PEZI|nr:major facilitator superfamily transporter [Microdochium trichocladiopsis]KAH7016138.1 major facilitator superfamily transporter [Microdochium trichocladiopsis]